MKIVYIEGEVSVLLPLKIALWRSKFISFKTHFPNAYGYQLWTTYRTPVMTTIPVPYNDVYRCLFKIKRGVSTSAIFVSKGTGGCNVLSKTKSYTLS